MLSHFQSYVVVSFILFFEEKRFTSPSNTNMMVAAMADRASATATIGPPVTTIVVIIMTPTIVQFPMPVAVYSTSHQLVSSLVVSSSFFVATPLFDATMLFVSPSFCFM